MAFMFVLSFIFLLPLITHQPAVLTTFLLFGARMCAMGTFTIAFIYAPEVRHLIFILLTGYWRGPFCIP